MDLHNFFRPKRIAVIGVSRNMNKVGHVIFKNLIDGNFPGEVFPVNRNAESLFNKACYKSVKHIPGKIDLGVIAVPADSVLEVIKECADKKIKDVLIVTAGFREIGNLALEEKLQELLNKNKMRCVGVNCLGIYDAHHKLDTLFLPRYRMERPKPGGISFVCQSGAIGSAILDIAAEKGHKFAKFISYGNATQVDESDLIEYLGDDKNTKVICLYVEGVHDGEKFYNAIKKVSKKKPIVAIKGGLTAESQEATLSHTGSLAGAKEVYFGIFKQTGAILANSLEEMFNIASLFEKEIDFKGNRIQIITNGGGYGIISVDNIEESKNLKLTQLSPNTIKNLRPLMPETVNIRNPLDLVGDATTARYKVALEKCIADKNVDGILLIALYQTPLITTDIVEVISELHAETDKPIIVVSTGGEFTEILSKNLEERGLPTFGFPEDAIKAVDKVVGYTLWMKKRKN